MKNFKKLMVTLLVAAMAFAAVPGSAFAASAYTPVTGTFGGEKTVIFPNYDQSQAHGDQTFTYNATYLPGLSETATGYAPAAPTVTNPVGTVTFTKSDFTSSSLSKTTGVTFDNITFNAPGVYAFNLVENGPGSGFTCNDNYTAYVTVENGGTAGILQIANVVYVKGLDQASPGTDTTKKSTAAPFTNTYADTTASLEVSKTVTGPFGDKTKDFEFTVTFTDITDDDFNAITYTATGNPTPTVNKDSANKTITFKLKDSDKVNFSTLPVGAHYTVAESNPGSGYNVSATVNSAAATLNNYTTPDKSIAQGDVVAFTNNATQSPVTGFVMNIAPYVGLLVIAVIAVVLIMKRRSTSNF